MFRFALGLLVAIGLAALMIGHSGAAGPSSLPRRAYVPLLAHDVEPTPTRVRLTPPPPGPGYCGPSESGPPTPPNAVFGLLTIGGSPAPAGTLVTLTFDGKPGPSAYTAAAGGYRVDYSAGGQGRTPRCINEVGTEMGLLVDGALTGFGLTVGDPRAGLALRVDVAIP